MVPQARSYEGRWFVAHCDVESPSENGSDAAWHLKATPSCCAGPVTAVGAATASECAQPCSSTAGLLRGSGKAVHQRHGRITHKVELYALIAHEFRRPADQHARAHGPEQADPAVLRTVIQPAIERRRWLIVLHVPRLAHGPQPPSASRFAQVIATHYHPPLQSTAARLSKSLLPASAHRCQPASHPNHCHPQIQSPATR